MFTPMLLTALIVVVVIGVDMVSGGSIRSAVRSGAALAHTGADRAYSGIASQGWFSSVKKLTAENQELREQVDSLKALRFEYLMVRAENDELRELLVLRDAYPEGVTARIVSTSSASPYGTFVVSTGSADGVERGDFVVGPGSVAVGRITDVQEHTSLAEAFFAPQHTEDALIHESVMPATGRGGHMLLVEAPRGISVVRGDIVRLAHTPFLLGTVGEVRTRPSDSIQQVFVSLQSLSGMNFVRIVPAP